MARPLMIRRAVQRYRAATVSPFTNQSAYFMPTSSVYAPQASNPSSLGASLSTTMGTPITAGATANTKGAFATIVAATPTDCCMLVLSFRMFTGSTVQTAVDIAIGPAGSEVVIIPNFVLGAASNLLLGSILLPLNLPAGTRISARSQSSNSSQVCNLSITTFDGALVSSDGNAGVDAFGFNSATSGGTQITPVANAKGNYFQLAAATPRDYVGLFYCIDFNAQSAFSNGRTYYFDIAIGPAGSEQVIVPNIPFDQQGVGAGLGIYLPIQIPAGTRIAARAQALFADRPPAMTVYGVYQ